MSQATIKHEQVEKKPWLKLPSGKPDHIKSYHGKILINKFEMGIGILMQRYVSADDECSCKFQGKCEID
jgi:hypothetical protein